MGRNTEMSRGMFLLKSKERNARAIVLKWVFQVDADLGQHWKGEKEVFPRFPDILLIFARIHVKMRCTILLVPSCPSPLTWSNLERLSFYRQCMNTSITLNIHTCRFQGKKPSST